MNSRTSQTPVVSLSKVASRVTLATAFLLASSVGLTPSFAADEKPISLETELADAVEFPVLLSQATAENTILLFTTNRYTVRVYQDGNQTLMNVYDATFDINRQFEAPTQFTILNNQGTYISTGSFAGLQARYEVSVINAQQARLLIRDGSGNSISNELSTSVSISRVDTQEQDDQNTILRFNTASYAVHVFEREGNRFMNVHNRFTAMTEVNGQAANLAPNEAPYENAVSYVSSGTRNGQPVEYFARIDAAGSTILEIFNINRQRLFQEPGEGPITLNIPSADLPVGVETIGGAESAYVAAVFGGQETLSELQQFYPDAFMDGARQGSFINVGFFPNRDSAEARVFELRGRGFNARVIFRDIDFR